MFWFLNEILFLVLALKGAYTASWVPNRFFIWFYAARLALLVGAAILARVRRRPRFYLAGISDLSNVMYWGLVLLALTAMRLAAAGQFEPPNVFVEIAEYGLAIMVSSLLLLMYQSRVGTMHVHHQRERSIAKLVRKAGLSKAEFEAIAPQLAAVSQVNQSRPVAREFLAWLAAPPGGHWLDVGSGTGALSQTILEAAAPLAVHGFDRSDGFVAYARAHLLDARASFETGDARDLSVTPAAFDAAVSGLVLNFILRPERMLAGTVRSVRPGGVVALYVWDYAGQMWLLRYFFDAAAALDPAAAELDEGSRFLICQPQSLAERFRAAGLEQVETRAIDVPTVFRDFDDSCSRSWAARAPRQAISCRSATSAAPPCASGCGPRCPARRMAPSRSSPAPGPSAAGGRRPALNP